MKSSKNILLKSSQSVRVIIIMTFSHKHSHNNNYGVTCFKNVCILPSHEEMVVDLGSLIKMDKSLVG